MLNVIFGTFGMWHLCYIKNGHELPSFCFLRDPTRLESQGKINWPGRSWTSFENADYREIQKCHDFRLKNIVITISCSKLNFLQNVDNCQESFLSMSRKNSRKTKEHFFQIFGGNPVFTYVHRGYLESCFTSGANFCLINHVHNKPIYWFMSIQKCLS